MTPLRPCISEHPSARRGADRGRLGGRPQLDVLERIDNVGRREDVAVARSSGWFAYSTPGRVTLRRSTGGAQVLARVRDIVGFRPGRPEHGRLGCGPWSRRPGRPCRRHRSRPIAHGCRAGGCDLFVGCRLVGRSPEMESERVRIRPRRPAALKWWPTCQLSSTSAAFRFGSRWRSTNQADLIRSATRECSIADTLKRPSTGPELCSKRLPTGRRRRRR